MCKQPRPRLRQVQEGQKGPSEGRQQIRKPVTLHNSQIFVWHEAVVWLEGFAPLHRKRIFMCFVGSDGTGRSRASG